MATDQKYELHLDNGVQLAFKIKKDGVCILGGFGKNMDHIKFILSNYFPGIETEMKWTQYNKCRFIFNVDDAEKVEDTLITMADNGIIVRNVDTLGRIMR